MVVRGRIKEGGAGKKRREITVRGEKTNKGKSHATYFLTTYTRPLSDATLDMAY